MITQLVTYLNSAWTFTIPFNKRMESNGVTIYKPGVRFGLVKSIYSNPNQIHVIGSHRDYFSQDRFGNLELITQEQFDLLYPKRTATPKKPLPSYKALNNPKKLTEVVESYKK